MKLPPIGPDDRVEIEEVTEAMKERFVKICGDLADWLMANTSSPKEAFICLEFLKDSMQRQYGLKAVGVHVGPQGLDA